MSVNEVTGDKLVTKIPTDAYRDNWDRIFKHPKEDVVEDKEVEHTQE